MTYDEFTAYVNLWEEREQFVLLMKERERFARDHSKRFRPSWVLDQLLWIAQEMERLSGRYRVVVEEEPGRPILPHSALYQTLPSRRRSKSRRYEGIVRWK